MLSLCFSHVATIASPFHSCVFHFLAKFSKICEIFFSCEKKTMKLSLLHKDVNTSSHKKSNLMALTTVYQFELWLKVRDMSSKLSLPRRGQWNLVGVKQVFELSEVDLTRISLYSKPMQNPPPSWHFFIFPTQVGEKEDDSQNQSVSQMTESFEQPEATDSTVSRKKVNFIYFFTRALGCAIWWTT